MVKKITLIPFGFERPPSFQGWEWISLALGPPTWCVLLCVREALRRPGHRRLGSGQLRWEADSGSCVLDGRGRPGVWAGEPAALAGNCGQGPAGAQAGEQLTSALLGGTPLADTPYRWGFSDRVRRVPRVWGDPLLRGGAWGLAFRCRCI